MTDAAFKQFATVGKQRAKRVRKKLKKRTHVTATDAASNEMLASELARGDVTQLGGDMSASTPHSVDIVRDRAHGLRRSASRPFQSITRLERNAALMFRSRGSPTQLIQHSKELRREFKPFLLSLGTSAKITNMSAAKHRFESWSKPAGRNCILARAVMAFVIKRLLAKRTEVRRFALRFLAYVSLVNWVLNAMMAEAWDELMAVVRMYDREEVGVERLAYSLSRFVSRCIYLFGPERGCLREGSYVHHVLATFKAHQFSWFVDAPQEIRSIGTILVLVLVLVLALI